VSLGKTKVESRNQKMEEQEGGLRGRRRRRLNLEKTKVESLGTKKWKSKKWV